jgi:spore coat polysaccharide biosynthesis protein SpsF
LSQTAIVVQARMGSARLPGKVMLPLAGLPILHWVLLRLAKCRAADSLVVATSTSDSDDPIADFCGKNGYLCFRGSEDDVLRRFIAAAQWAKADTVVRVTGDCPLVEPEIVDSMVNHFLASDFDYTSCVHVRSFPRGLDTEVVRVDALKKASRLATERRHREHVTVYIYENPASFRIASYFAEGEWRRSDIRLCLDDREDFQVLEEVLANTCPGRVEEVSVLEVIGYLDSRPDLLRRMQAAEARHNQKNLSEGIHQETLE